MFNSVLRAAALGLGLAVVSAPAAFAEGDPAEGKKVFRKCQACHTLDGKNRVGPTLQGLIGRKAGAVEGFRYSDAMKAYDVVWSAETLMTYLEDPRGLVRGTRMAFPGLKDEQDRADVIAYIIANQ